MKEIFHAKAQSGDTKAQSGVEFFFAPWFWYFAPLRETMMHSYALRGFFSL